MACEQSTDAQIHYTLIGERIIIFSFRIQKSRSTCNSLNFNYKIPPHLFLLKMLNRQEYKSQLQSLFALTLTDTVPIRFHNIYLLFARPILCERGM